MRKMMMFGVVFGLLATACGGAADQAAEAPAATTIASEGSSPGADTYAPGETDHTEAPPPTADSGNSPSEAPPTTGESPLATPTSKPAEPMPADPGEETVAPPAVDHPNPQVATAISDLIQRLGVAVDAVEVVSAEEVTWPNGSIGCPQPDMRYTQALVSGSRIVLRVNGVEYQYNSGGGREPFYCANPSDPVPGDGDYGDT